MTLTATAVSDPFHPPRVRVPEPEQITRWRHLAEHGNPFSQSTGGDKYAEEKLRQAAPILADLNQYNAGIDDPAAWRRCDTLESRRCYRRFVAPVEAELINLGTDGLDACGGVQGVVTAWNRHWGWQFAGIDDGVTDSVADPNGMPWERGDQIPDFSSVTAGFERSYQLWWWCGHPRQDDDEWGARYRLFVRIWLAAAMNGWPSPGDGGWVTWAQLVEKYRITQAEVNRAERQRLQASEVTRVA